MSKWPLVSGQTGYWYKDQSDYTTTASISTVGTWSKMVCELEYSLADNTIDLDDSTGQPGAAGDQVAGPQHGGTASLKGFLRGQAAAWGSTSAITQSPEMALISEFLGGSSLRDYVASAVGVGSDANTVTISTGTYLDGQFVAFGASATTVDSMGFVLNESTMALREDAGSIPASGDHCYGSVTAYTSSSQFTSKTLRILGGTTTRELLLTGWVPNKLVINMSTGTAPQWELEGTFTKHVWGSNGDDVAPAPTYKSLPAFIGDFGGRFTVNGAATANGAVDASDVWCGVVNQSVTITREQYQVDCPSASQGVAEIILGDPMVTMSFEVPIDSDDVASGTTVWDDYYTARTAISICSYLGTTAGQILAMCIPAARLSKRPTLKMVGGKLVGHQIEVKPGPYSDDAASTGPGNSAFSLASA